MGFQKKTALQERPHNLLLIKIIFVTWVVAVLFIFSITFTIGVAKEIVNLLNIKDANLRTVSIMENVNVIKVVEPTYEVFEITAYTAGYESTGKTESHPYYNITASGATAIERITIACPKSMEFGTKIYIPAFESVFTCQDRGSAITEGKLDVYMEDLEHAQIFGRQKLEVMILQ